MPEIQEIRVYKVAICCNWYFDLTPRHAMVKITTLEPSKARQGKHKGHTVRCKRCKAKQACYAKAKSTRRRRRTLFHKTVSWFSLIGERAEAWESTADAMRRSIAGRG